MPVLIDGLPVGRTTSGTWSPLRERPIAQAMVDADAAVPGVRVEVDIRGRSEQAAVVDVRSLMPEDR